MLLTAITAGCESASDYKSVQGKTMGTYYAVQVEAGESCNVDQAELDKVLSRFNQSLSTYIVDSEISQFNQRSSSEFFPVSERLAGVLIAAKTVWKQSNGAFDVTVGPLVNLWGFGPEDAKNPPTAQTQADAFKNVGMPFLDLRQTQSADGDNFEFNLRKTNPNVFLDFSALAKGLGVDEISELLAERGCLNYMVDIGGEVRTKGLSSKGRPWLIGIEAPDASRRGVVQRVLKLSDQSVATSGDYRNFRVIDKIRVDHVIDPRTGKSADNTVVSVSVVHGQAMLADAYATALMVLGERDGLRMAERLNLAVLVITKTSDERFIERYTSEMEDFFVELPE